jgi:hypothetical protein
VALGLELAQFDLHLRQPLVEVLLRAQPMRARECVDGEITDIQRGEGV